MIVLVIFVNYRVIIRHNNIALVITYFIFIIIIISPTIGHICSLLVPIIAYSIRIVSLPYFAKSHKVYNSITKVNL